MKKSSIAIFIILLTLIFILLSCKQRVTKIEKQDFVFGTLIKIVDYCKNPKKDSKIINAAFELMKKIDTNTNNYSPKSDIYKINHNINKFVKVSPETIKLLRNIEPLYLLSNKKYDITILPILKLWGLNNLNKTSVKNIPDKKIIRKTLNFVGYNHIIFKKNMVKVENPVKGIDVSSFLKGYGISKAQEYLKNNGLRHVMITGVSSIGTIGSKPNKIPWKIGLKNPENPQELIGIISLSNGDELGVSGNFEDFVKINGVKYAHIVNAKTGIPVKDVMMVVIICKNVYEADLYSTTMFLLKPKQAITIINKTKNMEGLIIDKNNKFYYSKNIKKYFKK